MPPFYLRAPAKTGRPPDNLPRLVPTRLPASRMASGHLGIHGASSFSRHKLVLLKSELRGLIRSSRFDKTCFGFHPQILEPHILAHFDSISFARPEIRRGSAINRIPYEVKRHGGAIGQDGFFEMNQFEFMLHESESGLIRIAASTIVRNVCLICSMCSV